MGVALALGKVPYYNEITQIISAFYFIFFWYIVYRGLAVAPLITFKKDESKKYRADKKDHSIWNKHDAWVTSKKK